MRGSSFFKNLGKIVNQNRSAIFEKKEETLSADFKIEDPKMENLEKEDPLEIGVAPGMSAIEEFEKEVQNGTVVFDIEDEGKGFSVAMAEFSGENQSEEKETLPASYDETLLGEEALAVEWELEDAEFETAAADLKPPQSKRAVGRGGVESAITNVELTRAEFEAESSSPIFEVKEAEDADAKISSADGVELEDGFVDLEMEEDPIFSFDEDMLDIDIAAAESTVAKELETPSVAVVEEKKTKPPPFFSAHRLV